MLRFEVLLPLFYNDGTPVEPERFLETDEDILAQFGASSTDTVRVRGHWVYEGVRYSDQLIRIRVDAPNSTQVREFFKQLKVRLKARFRQEEIWITAHEIEII